MLANAPALARARLALEGLSIGDAFGERFFAHFTALTRMWFEGKTDSALVRSLDLGPPPWRWTDDTAMALSIVATLQEHGAIDEYALARRFALAYAAEPRRGYGPAMHTLLPRLRWPGAWETAPRDLFRGQGSFGNGAAMRVAPVGAFFADDLEAVIDNARRSAAVTHAHPEGIAGAIAVAVAAAWAWRLRESTPPAPREFLDLILPSIPQSEVADKTRQARDLDSDATVFQAAALLGNGSNVTAHDTVPFVLWSAARTLNDYAEALWQTVSGLGDMDTTCAMVGGIVALSTGETGIPAGWRQKREPLPSLNH
jgi:ADP-ribosylglycohydrolase